MAISSNLGFPANVALAAHAREPLEHLCRYLLRPPLALERLTESSGGQLLYQLPGGLRLHELRGRLGLSDSPAAPGVP